MSSAFESEASFPVLLDAGLAGSVRAIGVGVSSRRKRPRNPPFFFSAVASAAAGCAGGGAHSSARDGIAFVAADSCCGAGAPQGSAFAGCSFGLALGAQAFAGASVDAGGGVVQDSGGLPPPGARHQSFGSCGGVSFVAGVGACGCGTFAAGPGANRPERDDSLSSTAGGTSTAGAGGSGTGAKPPMRCAISFCRSSRIGGGGETCSGSPRCSVGASGVGRDGVVLLDQSGVGRAVSSGASGGHASTAGGGGAGHGGGVQERDKISAFEVCFGRRLPWRELEVGLRDRKDRAEGVLASLAIHDRRDEASASEAEGTDLGIAPYLELPCLRSACEETYD